MTEHRPLYGSPEYHEGVAAYRRTGEPSSPCPADAPYPKSDTRRASWFLGWVDARTADCINNHSVAKTPE